MTDDKSDKDGPEGKKLSGLPGKWQEPTSRIQSDEALEPRQIMPNKKLPSRKEQEKIVKTLSDFLKNGGKS